METPYTRGGRQQPIATPPSPRLLRSRSSGIPAISQQPAESRTCNNHLRSSSQRFNANRSKSTTRSRNHNNEENINPSTLIKSSSTQKKPSVNNKEAFVRFMQRGSPRNQIPDSLKKVKSVTNSPSAWALSPGRSSPCSVPPESPCSGARRVKSSSLGGGAVAGVLKYFRQKKVSPVQAGEYHKFRVIHNRLLLYRFANARAEAGMASLKNVAEGKIFCLWLSLFKMRNVIMEKKFQIQKLKHEIKLYQLLNPQIALLNEWAELEGKNCQAMGRVTGKLSAVSVKMPFDDAKADAKSIYEAMGAASAVMSDIEATIAKLNPQVEKILYMLTELISMVELEEESLKELDKTMAFFPPLMETEKYLRVQLIHAAEPTSQGEKLINKDHMKHPYIRIVQPNHFVKYRI